MVDLINEIGQKTRLLDSAVKELRIRGQTYAQAQHDYRVALSKKVLLERDKGTPVTIMSDICRGDPQIAKLRFERDVAEVVYKAALEAINSYKLQIRILDAQVEREWNSASTNQSNGYFP